MTLLSEILNSVLRESLGVDISQIVDAINNRYAVHITYSGDDDRINLYKRSGNGKRLIQPYVIGKHRTTGNLVLRAYQMSGDTTDGISNGWKFFRIDRITSWNPTNYVFHKPISGINDTEEDFIPLTNEEQNKYGILITEAAPYNPNDKLMIKPVPGKPFKGSIIAAADFNKKVNVRRKPRHYNNLNSKPINDIPNQYKIDTDIKNDNQPIKIVGKIPNDELSSDLSDKNYLPINEPSKTFNINDIPEDELNKFRDMGYNDEDIIDIINSNKK